MGVMKATLVLIGGGEIGNNETYPLDQKVRSFSKKASAHMLFLGTASEDPEGYDDAVERVYGELGCEVRPLHLASETPSREALQEALDWADMVYLGGGNTKFLLKRLQETGFAQMMIRALDEREDLVVAGLSAGASCWCECSYADCDIMDGVSEKMVFLPCLGYLPFVFNPHAQDPARSGFVEELKKIQFQTAYSLENDTALVIQGKKTKMLLKGYEEKKGWRISRSKKNELIFKEL